MRQVASGWSDYLAEGQSVPLFWAGRGAGAVGLVGEVGVGELEGLLEGRDPERLWDRDARRVAHGKRKTMGWELSWAPPKSASALWAVGSVEAARAVEESMVAATGEALRVWEGAVWARQDGGWVHTDGMLAARASGTTNRNGDPQLHHHVVVANLARRRTDGRWRALDGQLLWPGRSWATQVWGRTFRRELSSRTGLRWGPANRRGDRELVDVPAELVALWSSRDREIDEEQARLEDELGRPVGKAARLIISGRTRRHKDLAERMGERRVRWRSEAETCVPGVVDRLQNLSVRPTVLRRSGWSAPSLAVATAADLSERRAVWDSDEWLRTCARVAGDGVGTGVLEEWSAETLGAAGAKESPVLGLLPVRVGRQIREAGLLYRPGGERWTTVENRRREDLAWGWFHNPGKEKGRDGRWTVSTTAAQAIAILKGLDPEQTEAVVGWAAGDARGGILIGPGGTGKTTTLSGLAAVGRAEGVPVRVMAVSQAATKEAAEAVGTPGAVNIARFLKGTQDRQQWANLAGGWWVVDEASMVTSAHWAAIIERAEAAGAAILAVGDPAQIGPVRSASLFGTVLSTDAPRWELTTLWRIEEEWEQAASLQLRARDPHGVDLYHTAERIVGYQSRGEMCEAVAGWVIEAETRDADVLVSVATNREADDLNNAVQNLLAQDRDPDGPEVVLHWTEKATGESLTRRIQVGDLVRTRRNDWGRHTSSSNGRPVLNGDVWRVTGIEAGRITARSVDKGRRRVATFGVAYVGGRDPGTGRPWVEHGWVSTAHSVQGRTVDAAVAIVGSNSRAETLYVAASRGRRNWLVGVGTPVEVADTAKAALGRVGRQPTALDHGIRSQGDAEAWVDVLPPGLAAADIKQRAIQSGLTPDQAADTACRYTSQQLARARDWVLAQDPYQNPEQLAEAAVRYWCLSPAIASPLAALYTAQEEKRVAAEREEINRARQAQAARWEQARNIERSLGDQRRELDRRERTLRHQLHNVDTEQEQRGLLSRRLGARQRAAEAQRIRDELQTIEAQRRPINHAEGLARQWRDTQSRRKETILVWVRDLPEGLDADTAHRETVRRWGLGVDAAQALDLWTETEKMRARNRKIHRWWQNLADGLKPDQVRAEAEQRWGPHIDADALADDYRHAQIRKATAWVRSLQTGAEPEQVAAEARKRFGIGDHPDQQLTTAYLAAAAQRSRNATTWLEQNDNWNTAETDQAAAIAGFGLEPRHAQWLVAKHRHTRLTAWVNDNLANDLPTHQANQLIRQRWGNSRYADMARAEWHHRQQQQQEQQRPHRGRPGLSL